jgi:hypothetical protein
VRDPAADCRTGHLFDVSRVLRTVTLPAIVDEDDVVSCGCGETCIHAPVLEEIVLPPVRPTVVGMTALDRHGLVAMAHRRGMLAFTGRGS